jgi:hypothetical protein
VAVAALNRAIGSVSATTYPTFMVEMTDVVAGDDVFIIGGPRSGTTLVYQICAGFLGFGYFSNLAAVTWQQPEIGLIIAERFRHNSSASSLRSSFGQTLAWFEPHEAGRIWEVLLGVRGLQQPESRIDLTGVTCALERFRGITGRRMTYKGLFLTWSLASFAQQYPKSRFIVVSRSLVDTVLSMLSLYNARNIQTAFVSLASRAALDFAADPLPERVAAQVYFNDAFIRTEVEHIAPRRIHFLSLERLISSPSQELSSLADFTGMPLSDDDKKKIQRQLRTPDEDLVDKDVRRRIERRLDALAGQR